MVELQGAWWLYLLVFLLFSYLFWQYYWKLQLIYNGSILSTKTPESFTLENPERAHVLETHGWNVMRHSRVVFATLLRDVEERLPTIEKKVERMGRLFRDYRVIVVENDSTDQTRPLLLDWARRNPRVTILGCGVNQPECHLNLTKTEGHSVTQNRIEKMCTLRNIYLQEIRDLYASWDWAIVWDLDAIATVYHDGVAHSFGYLLEHPEVSAICATGIYRWAGVVSLFYDTYAYLYKGESFHIKDKIEHDLRKGIRPPSRGEEPFEVDSCFSGFTIYRIRALTSPRVKYQMSSDDSLECEHVSLSRSLPGKKVLNPSMLHLLLHNA